LGYQFQSLQDNETETQYAAFNFSNNETAQFNSTGTLLSTTGLAYAGFLLGAVDSANAPQYAVAEIGGRYKTNAVYVQDDYKASSRLTINLGLRENIWSPFTEVNNVMSFFQSDSAESAGRRHTRSIAVRGQRNGQLQLLDPGSGA